MPNDTTRAALSRASMEAARLHMRLGTSFEEPVDVFLVAQRLGLWLASQPLDRTFGFYLRQGDVAGVVLNSRHPESLQRYTCAHEIGHHILRHDSHTDVAGTINDFAQSNVQELQAQVFAASLLMPLPLVERALGKIMNGRRAMRPEDVYMFSRDVGVSYQAAVWHLAELKKLPKATARSLAKISPAAIKDQLRGSSALSDARADVWLLEAAQARDSTISCRVDDEVHIRVPEDLSTGHIWSIDEHESTVDNGDETTAIVWDGAESLADQIADNVRRPSAAASSAVAVLQDTHQAAADSSGDRRSDHEFQSADLPAPGYRSVIVTPRRDGDHALKISLRPAWNQSAAAIDEIRLIVSASERKTLPYEGYAEPQQSIRVRELAA